MDDRDYNQHQLRRLTQQLLPGFCQLSYKDDEDLFDSDKKPYPFMNYASFSLHLSILGLASN